MVVVVVVVVVVEAVAAAAAVVVVVVAVSVVVVAPIDLLAAGAAAAAAAATSPLLDCFAAPTSRQKHEFLTRSEDQELPEGSKWKSLSSQALPENPWATYMTSSWLPHALSSGSQVQVYGHAYTVNCSACAEKQVGWLVCP